MEYTKSRWKHNLRSTFYKLISPKLYVTIMPAYYMLFNKKRRGCTYKFFIEENGVVAFYSNGYKFNFFGYRRVNRYVYPNGLERKKNAMKRKYCISECTVEPGDTVVEVGANVGEFTIMASEIAHKVFAFEPDPDVFSCLENNTSPFKNIKIVKFGASKANGTETFYLSGEDADSSLIEPKSYSKEVKVNTVRLDSWMDSTMLTKIDFLKIEAEGAEMEVLEGLGEKISYVRKISVDGGPERFGEPTCDDVDRYLKSKGFSTRVIGYHVYGWRK